MMMSKRLPSDKAESTLRAMLENAGLKPDALELDKAWDVFIEFCNMPIESKTDGIVALWGPRYKSTADAINEGEKIGFSYSLMRQFDDESDEYQNLILECRYRLDDKLENIDEDNTDW
jgi:hypothetical protein